MKISDEKLVKLFELFHTTIVSGIENVYNYIERNLYIPQYYNFPKKHFDADERIPEIQELIDAIASLNNGIPFFYSTDFDTPLRYGEIFSIKEGKYRISCKNLDGFQSLIDFIESEADIKSMLQTNIEYSVLDIIKNIINRYLYETGSFSKEPINEEIVKSLISLQINRFYLKKLPLTICIPICFLLFDSDEIPIAEEIQIKRMPEKFQISRYRINNFQSTQENQAAQCALYMLYLQNYVLDNSDKATLSAAATNKWGYPISVIDDFFAAVRIETGYSTGYGQLIMEPEGWADEWTTDMPPLYGTVTRSFNVRDSDVKLFNFPIQKVCKQQVKRIQELFSAIQSKRVAGEKEFNKVFIAIQRLNRCMLREENDDTALDAIIGIETLLSGGTQGEITYTISNRMAVVAAKLDECPYSSAEARYAMKKIYGYRSDIVHGRENSKNEKISISGKDIPTQELAIEFLRYSLSFLIRNQAYLDVKLFEDALDTAIGS